MAITPSPDVYGVLTQNPGLAASLPIYSQPPVAGRYSSLTVIGDSYADWGNVLSVNPQNSSLVGADGRYGNALNIVDALQYHYALPTGAVTNYAWGGATSGSINNNPPQFNLPGYAQEMQVLVNSGRRFGASDLITFTNAAVGGGNDTPLGISVAQGTANIVGYLNTLVGLGGQNFLINMQPTLGSVALNRAATATLQAALAPFASEGVNVTLFDETALVDNILASPAAYGFASDATATDYCARLGGTHVCNEGGQNRARIQTTAEIFAQDQYLYFYGHPTTALAAQFALGDASLLDASAQAVPEPSSLGLLGSGLLAVTMAAARRRCEGPSRPGRMLETMTWSRNAKMGLLARSGMRSRRRRSLGLLRQGARPPVPFSL